jgi:thiol-disulfide isomerase/thioredoxin
LTGRDLAIALAVCGLAAAAGFTSYRVMHAAKPAGDELRADLEFRDLKGQRHKLSEWNGKLLLVNFWATWCAPCLKEIPLLVETQQKNAARGLQVVGIAMDDVEPVRQMSKRLEINYPVMAGGAEISAAMDSLGDRLGALPFSVLIGPGGEILDRRSGALTAEELQDWLAKLPS